MLPVPVPGIGVWGSYGCQCIQHPEGLPLCSGNRALSIEAGPVCALLGLPLEPLPDRDPGEHVHGRVGHWRLRASPGTEVACALGAWPTPVCILREHAQAGEVVHAISVSHEGSPRMLTGPLPILQMAPSEGTVTQIGLLSQDIHRLTVGP